jgi:hypothetical protein
MRIHDVASTRGVWLRCNADIGSYNIFDRSATMCTDSWGVGTDPGFIGQVDKQLSRTAKHGVLKGAGVNSPIASSLAVLHGDTCPLFTAFRCLAGFFFFIKKQHFSGVLTVLNLKAFLLSYF